MKICIAGDSWGVGELGAPNGAVEHQGLAQYFAEAGADVKNVSRVGFSNKISSSLIPTYKFDYIFWFQSDPLRDLRPYHKFEQYNTIDKLLEKSRECLIDAYTRLNSMGVVIHCIGGCSEINLDLIKDFKNLVPIIPSVTRLIWPEFQHPPIWVSDWMNKIDRQFDLNELDRIIVMKDHQLSLGDNKEYFFPDGYHPNRKGHRVIYDYICKELKLLR
jgi:hypothetical protein